MSQDINNYSFYLRVLQDGELLVMDESYEVEVLSVFTTSKTRLLTKGTIKSQYVDWVFDPSYISKSEVVKNYVYVRKNGVLLVSADANCFIFSVGLSAIDSDVGRVAEVYDENYEKVLLDYSGALDDRTAERLDEAVLDFNQRGDAEIVDWRGSADVELEDYLADRVVLENLVINGDFRDGLNGWANHGSAHVNSIRTVSEDPVSSSGYSLKVYRDNDQTSSFGVRQFFSFDKSSKFYVRVGMLRLSTDGTTSNIPLFTTESPVTTNVGRNDIYDTWQYVSNVFDKTRLDIPLYLNLSLDNTSGGLTTYYDNVILINLTATFGAGNEPSKEWMDRLVERTGYFDEHILDENWQVGEITRLNDTKANKKQEGWITPTLMNGFTGDLKYRKTAFGQLEMRGYLEYPSVLNTNTLPCFAFVEGYTPRWINSSGYSDRRLKMTLERDIAVITGGIARASISGYNNHFYITDGGGGTRWHINALIPMD